jgi:PDZ domain-containing protein
VDTSIDNLTDVDPPADPADPDAVALLTPEELRRRKRKARWLIGIVSAVLFIAVVLIVATVVHVPYYLLSPGTTYRTQSVIKVKGDPTYPQTGTIYSVTVSVTTREATALEWTLAHLDSSITIAKASDIVPPDQSPADNEKLNLEQMADSKTIASVVALDHLGYHVEATASGAEIVAVVKDSPAAKVLKPGDTIVGVGGTPVEFAQDLSKAIQSHHPGDEVSLDIEPVHGGAKVTRTVTLATSPANKDLAFLGVKSQDHDLRYPDLPVQISVSTPEVGGPSAGLAFTLGIMDVMTRGSITGGHKVATTGTIDANGCVGPIGGMHQKVLAVKAAGAQEMLVPRSEYAEAKKYSGSLAVVPVDDIDQALAALTKLGGGYKVLPTQSHEDKAGCTG